MSGRILVTGGTGYIGSHTVVELLHAGYEVTIADNLSNSKLSVLDRVERIAGRRPGFLQVDLRDLAGMRLAVSSSKPTAVIHFAGLKAVGESVRKPVDYYDNNVTGTLNLLRAMGEEGVKQLVFSSSATVYGDPETVPIDESAPLSATNPYGQTKLVIESLLRDLAVSDGEWHIALLRYFNPVGAHESGLIGEDPNGIPNNLMPYISQVAAGRLKELAVFGHDYPTPDGTGVRDYIHVADLAAGHVAALEALHRLPGARAINLGTGQGYSVLEVIRAFAAASGQRIPYRTAERRAGDIACCYANPTLATELLGWKAQRKMDQMCQDAWRWQQWAASNNV